MYVIIEIISDDRLLYRFQSINTSLIYICIYYLLTRDKLWYTADWLLRTRRCQRANLSTRSDFSFRYLPDNIWFHALIHCRAPLPLPHTADFVTKRVVDSLQDVLVSFYWYYYTLLKVSPDKAAIYRFRYHSGKALNLCGSMQRINIRNYFIETFFGFIFPDFHHFLINFIAAYCRRRLGYDIRFNLFHETRYWQHKMIASLRQAHRA